MTGAINTNDITDSLIGLQEITVFSDSTLMKKTLTRLYLGAIIVDYERQTWN